MTNKKRIFLNGKRFGMLTVTANPPIKKGRHYYWECACDCGNKKIVREDSLTGQHTKSCGCMIDEKKRLEYMQSFIGFSDGTLAYKIGAITKSNKSGFVGVNWDKSRNKWQASIRFRWIKYHIGRYDDMNDAISAREKAEDEIKKYLDSIHKNKA